VVKQIGGNPMTAIYQNKRSSAQTTQ